MNHTPQIKKAIQFAADKHRNQFRKGENGLPYITHLFSVALLVAEDGAHDDVVTAALLHDTIEDTGTTREEIVEAFNEQVALMVSEVSEPKELPWKERKQVYINQIEVASDGALLVAIADKIDNTEGKLEDFAKQGKDEFLALWTRPMSDYLWFNSECLRIVQARFPDHALTKRFAEAHSAEKATLASL